MIDNPTPDQLIGEDPLVPIQNASGIVRSEEDLFRGEIAKKRLDAQKKTLPFAIHALLAERKTHFDEQINSQKARYGFVKEALKAFKPDWNRYSDLKNFEIIEQGERVDEQLSKRANKTVAVHFIVYAFKGRYETYTIMEDGIEASARVEKEERDKYKK